MRAKTESDIAVGPVRARRHTCATRAPGIERLHAELVKAIKSADLAERIRAQAYDVWTLTPGEFTTLLRTDHAHWGKIVKTSGAKAD